jgi:hypothetical protein
VEYSNTTGLPSVTDILTPWIDKRWFKDYHSKRGQSAHDFMACYALDLPFLGKGFNPLWKSYIESGQKWFDDNIKKVLLVEERFQVGDYCGQPDLVAILNSGVTALVDWKTSVAEAKYWKFQTAAYQNLIERNTTIKIDVRICVRLRKDFGRPALVNKYKNYEYDLGIFNCAKAVCLALK